MHFSLLDRITRLEPGKAISAVKCLSLAEEYLQDHFPKFPVMPGVLMLESMYQTGAWLVRVSEDFSHSMVILREARNVRYAGFVQPGQTLDLFAEIIKQDATTTTLKAQGSLGETVAVSARLILERYNLAARETTAQQQPGLDQLMKQRFREIYRILYQPAVTTAAPVVS